MQSWALILIYFQPLTSCQDPKHRPYCSLGGTIMTPTIGHRLKSNMMAGIPTRMKNFPDYIGHSIPPCGDFMETTSPTPTPPWITQSGSSYSLHDEIKLFLDYMTPSPQEVAIRKDLINRFTALIASFGTKATVMPFGSYVTGLYLPTSDIDMVLIQPKNQAYDPGSSLREIYYKICYSNFASEVVDLLEASVPLIRITDRETGIEIDLIAKERHSIRSTQAVQKRLQEDRTGIVRMLIFVIKTFLAIRRCGTTYTGGINSYVLVWMIVAWFALEWPKIKDSDLALSNVSLGGRTATTPISSTTTQTEAIATQPSSFSDYGKALKGFLEFYGLQFDHYKHAIKIEPTPQYQPKRYTHSQFTVKQRFLLSIFDPADTSIDMGAKAYGINNVKATFLEAYNALETRSGNGGHVGEGLLGAILGGDFTKFVEKRNRIGRLTV